MNYTVEQKKAIERFCKDYGYDDIHDLARSMKEWTDDILEPEWFNADNDEECCYNELVRYSRLMA